METTRTSFDAASRISVVECWGNLTEYKITSEIYGEAYIFGNLTAAFGFNSIDERMESFDMFLRPMSVNRTDTESWFLHGLMWDLLDNRNEILRFGTTVNSELRLGDDSGRSNFIVDNCSLTTDPFNLSTVFNALDGDVEDGCEFYYRLVNQNPNQQAQLEELFNSYGYGCFL